MEPRKTQKTRKNESEEYFHGYRIGRHNPTKFKPEIVYSQRRREDAKRSSGAMPV
jgi:hypothetical protein